MLLRKEKGGVWIPDGEGHRIPERIGVDTTGPPVKVFNPNGTSSMGSVLLSGPGGRSCRLSLNPLTGRVRFYKGGREVAVEE